MAATATRRLNLFNQNALRPVVSPFHTPVRHATLKSIQMRIKAVSNIQKITQSMKMVAAAKLRQVQDKSSSAKAFTSSSVNFLQKEFGDDETEAGATHLIVPFTGDKGLCGSVNSNVVRFIKKHILENPGYNYKIVCVGQKGADGLKSLHSDSIELSFRDVGAKGAADWSQAAIVADHIITASNDADRLTVVYPQFINAMTQRPNAINIPTAKSLEANAGNLDEYDFDTDKEFVVCFDDMYEFQMASLVHGFLLETATSEHGARMTAMDSASTNASELIEKLTVFYNKARQAKVTNDLIEVISGAEAV